MRSKLRQARDLERRQVFALQVLGERLAVPRVVPADKEPGVLEAAQRLRNSERAAEMRPRDERLAEHDAKPRLFEHPLPALLHHGRAPAEDSGRLLGGQAATAT